MAQIPPQTFHLKNGTPVIIRCGTEADALPLRITIKSYIAENEGMVFEPDEYKRTETEVREWIQKMSENPNEIILLAIVDGNIVGNIDFHVGTRRRVAHTGEFGMGMLPEFRSQGLGTILLNSMLRWAEQVPALEKINLNVVSTNQRAIGLYKKFGFQEEGRRMRELKYADGTYTDNVSMGKFIRI